MRHPLALCAFLAASISFTPARAGDLNAYSECSGPGRVSVTWEFYESPGGPAGHPEWVGYDILRRSVADCGDWTRRNPAILPRIVGQTHGGVFLDDAAGAGVTWEYRVVPVDAARQPVILLSPHCEPPCVPLSWASCPQASAALVVGTVSTMGSPGGMLWVMPCAGSCFGMFNAAEPQAEALRPYADTGTVLRLFGTAVCGGVEGCTIEVTAFELAVCGITPATSPTWGSLKLRYR